jgi:hypothetical protein
MNCNDLFVVLAFRAMIEAHHHDEIVVVSPTSDENKVGDLERQTLRQMARCGGNAGPGQGAHKLAQANSSPLTIVNAERYEAGLFSPVRKAWRIGAIERIEVPCRLEGPRHPGWRSGGGNSLVLALECVRFQLEFTE